jgi:hypothetical protein
MANFIWDNFAGYPLYLPPAGPESGVRDGEAPVWSGYESDTDVSKINFVTAMCGYPPL